MLHELNQSEQFSGIYIKYLGVGISYAYEIRNVKIEYAVLEIVSSNKTTYYTSKTLS